MRISVISAAVCCALFSAFAADATPLSVEQRLAQLEARLNHAEREAGEANRRVQQAEQRTTAAEQRAAAAEKQIQTLSQRTAVAEQKQQATDKQLAKSSLSDGFEFNAYARAGMLVDSHGKGARGGPGISPASSLNGDAHVGRLGNEKDNYVELSFGKKMTFSDGSWTRFKTMLADGATNPTRGYRITTAII